MTGHSLLQRSFVSVIIATLVLVAFPPTEAPAQNSVSFEFGGAGIYPQIATANSQRWIRVRVRYDTRSTISSGGVDYQRYRNHRVRLYEHTGAAYTHLNYNEAVTVTGVTPSENYRQALRDDDGLMNFVPLSVGTNGKHTGNTTEYGVHRQWNATEDYTLTVGPFTNYYHDLLVGRLRVGTRGLRAVMYYQEFLTTAPAGYRNREVEVFTSHTTTTLAIPGYTHWPENDPRPLLTQSGEMQAWYNGVGTGIDPLEITRSADGSTHNADDGSSSDRYTFRTRYIGGLGGWPGVDDLPVTWGHGNRGIGGHYVSFDIYSYIYHASLPIGVHMHGEKRAVSATQAVPWLYDPQCDRHLDLIGDGGMGAYDPQAILIIDHDYNNPHYMQRETVSGNVIDYRYDLLPTNFLQLVNNIWTLPFDNPGADAWDTYASGVRGLPASNAYVSMRAGGHTYEFLTTRDFHPPVARIVDPEYASGAKSGPRSVALRGRPGSALEVVHIVNMPEDYPYLERYTEQIGTWFNDKGAGGFGYPFDSQDKTKNPEVNPALTGYPFFGRTGDYADILKYDGNNTPINPEVGRPAPYSMLGGPMPPGIGPGIAGSLATPFDPTGAGLPWGGLEGPTGPQRWTNQDTIWPNLANIFREDQDPQFRGGKWTEDSTFVFRINYWQSLNFDPQFIQVEIRRVVDGVPGPWQAYSMQKADPTDQNFRNGVVYYFERGGAELGGSGDYQYRFRAGDGKGTAIFPNRPNRNDIPAGWRPPNDPGQIGVAPGDNDYYWFRVNHKPILRDQEVTPASAPSGSHFKYRVTYRDHDMRQFDSETMGDPPYKSLVHIDYSGDANVLTINNVVGNVVHYTAATRSYSDNILRNMQIRRAPDFAFNPSWIIPATNTRTGPTTGTITVTNAAGLAVGQTIRVWFTAVMDPVTPVDMSTDYSAGVVYEYDTARAGVELDPGKHRYYFEFWDNWAYWIHWGQYFNPANPAQFSAPVDYKVEGEKVRYPEAGFHPGPEIIENTPPHLSRFYFESPVADRVAGVAAGTITYTRPEGLALYGDGDLAGMLVEMRSGTATGHIYQITGNTGDTITVADVPANPSTGNPIADGVMAGNRFRIFEDRLVGADGNYYLSYGYNTIDPDGTAATPFHVFLTYTDAENNAPSVLRIRIYNDAAATAPANVIGTYNMQKVTPGDNAYADGVAYRTITPVQLPSDGADVGNYFIRAQAFDGTEWYGDQYSPPVAPGHGTFFGPLTAPGEIKALAAKGPDIAPNQAPMLGFDVGEGQVAAFMDNVFTYTDSLVDPIGTNPIVRVYFAGHDYRVQSHDPATNTITLYPQPENSNLPQDDGYLVGAAFSARVELDPRSGLDTDTYTYWVVYTDEDDYAGVRGNPPEYVRVYINGEEFDMAAYDELDRNMTDGKVYSYSTDQLPISQNHRYYFMASDTLDVARIPPNAPDQLRGPIVHINTPPELTDGAVNPTEGTEEVAPGDPREFVFTVTYTDADNHPPAEVLLHILNTDQAGADWQEFEMERDLSAPDPLNNGDFTDGEQYTVSAFAFKTGENTIGDGRHIFFFTTEDSHGLPGRDPESGAVPDHYIGPTINDPPNAPFEGFDPGSPDYPATAPDVNDPANLTVVSTRTPTISWTANDELDPNTTDTAATLRYVVEISREKDFSVIARTLESAVGTPSVTVPAANQLADKMTYYYRVKTIDQKGAESGWNTDGLAGEPYGAVTAFHVDTNRPPFWPAPLTVADFVPTGDINTRTPLLDWPEGADPDPGDPVGSLRYRVQVDDNPDFNDPEYDSFVATGDWLLAGVTQREVPAGRLAWGVTYYWRVQIFDGEATSLWTNERDPQILPSFTTRENMRPLPPTSGFRPAANVNFGETSSLRPTFRFDPGSDAEDPQSLLRYEVQLWDTDDWATAGNLVAAADRISAQGDPRVVMTPASAELDPGIVGGPDREPDPQFFWRVRTIDTAGLTSNWSATQTFWLNTANEAPWAPTRGFLPVPEPGETEVWLPERPGHGGVAPLRWNRASDPDHRHDPDYFPDQLRYTVELSTNADFSAVPHQLTTGWGVTQIAVPANLTRGVKWYWRVFTEDREGAISEPSHDGGPGDPAPSFWVNRPPVLSNGSVAPLVPGEIGENDNFVFEVTYTDLDNHAPQIVEVIVTPRTPTRPEVRVSMQERDVAPYDYQAGVVYQAIVTGVDIQPGEHSFYFEANDGFAAAPSQLFDPSQPAGTEFEGPLVNDPPNPVTAGFNPEETDPLTIRHSRVPTISWSAASDPNATDPPASLRYRLEFSQVKQPFAVQAPYTRTTAAGVTNAQPLASLPEGVWYYRLITIDRYGAESAPSAVHGFRVRINRDPNAPVPIGEYWPPNGSVITNRTPLLQWPDATDPDPADSPGTLAYDVQLATDTNFTNPVVNLRTPEGESEHQVVPQLALGVTYYWRVRTVDRQGGMSPWSTEALGLATPLSFSVTHNTAPNPPTTGFVPSGGVEVGLNEPVLRWGPGTDPDPMDTPDLLHYEVQLDDNDVWTDPNIFEGATLPGVTEIAVTPALAENGQFWWRVRTIDPQGAVSAWSQVNTFYVNEFNEPPTAPASGFSPAEGVEITQQLPTLRWDPSDDPDPLDDETNLMYIVELDTTGTFTPALHTYQSAVGQASLTVETALARGSWFWRVRARDAQGAQSPWSAVQTFDVDGNNAPQPPQDGFNPTNGAPVTSFRPTLRWNPGSDIDPSDTPNTLRYEVQVNDSSDWSALPHVFTTTPPHTAEGVTQVQVNVDLTENAQYWYRVRTIDGQGAVSDWSATQMFWVNTQNDNPLPPTSGFRPRNGEETELRRPPLNWNPGSDPDDPAPECQQTDSPDTLRYTVQLSTDEDFNPPDYQYTTTVPGQTQLIPANDLADRTTYYWRVRTVDPHGAVSAWSLVQFFNVDVRREPATLTEGAVTPVLGYLNTTYEFSVIYTDPENEPPIGSIRVRVNRAGGAEVLDLVMQRDVTDTNAYSNGVRYIASVRGDDPALGFGSYVHHYRIAGTNVRHPADPGTVTGPVIHTLGTIRLADDTWTTTDNYEEGDTIYIEVTDADQNLDPAVRETITVTVSEQGGGVEEVDLLETGPNTGVFRGDLLMRGAPGPSGDGILNVVSGAAGNQITATWADPAEVAVGGPPATTTALVTDTIAPRRIAAGELDLDSGGDGTAVTISWTDYDEHNQPNNQDDVQRYRVWQSTAAFDNVADATLIAGDVPAATQTYTVEDLTIGQQYWFAVTVQDEVPNEHTTAIASRSVVTEDNTAPYLANLMPARDATGVARNTNIRFDVLDDGLGVNEDTIRLWIDGTEVDRALLQIAPIARGFRVTHQPAAPFPWAATPEDGAVVVEVRAEDLAVPANVHQRADTDWTFSVQVDDTAPTIDQLRPTGTNVAADTEIGFRVRDAASGVDRDAITLSINGAAIPHADLVFDPAPASAGPAEVTVTYQPDERLNWSTEYTIEVAAADTVGNPAAANWTFTTRTEPTFEITGTITGPDGRGMSGVRVEADGRNFTTDANGAYRITNLTEGAYTVTPRHGDYTFAPPSHVDVTVGPSERDRDFTATLRTYSIRGTVTRGGQGVAGVRVSDGTRSAVTNADGNYEITGVPNGDYILTCSRDANEDGHEDFTYSPASLTVPVDGADVDGQNFRATAVTYSISGMISNNRGDRISGVTVSDGTRTAVTDETGRYTIAGVGPGTVTLTPTRTGMAFDPENIQVTVPPDSTGNNFTAYTAFSREFGAGLRMIGVPAEPPVGRDRAVDIFRTDRVARWNPSANPPAWIMGAQQPDHFELRVRPGAAFFVQFPAATNLRVPGDAVSTTGTFSIGLATGWNQVGNMYEASLPLANMNASASTRLQPYAFIWDPAAGSYRLISRAPAFNSARTYMEAWEGAWFRATGTPGSLNVQAPVGVASETLLEGRAARISGPDNGWLLPIVARVGDRADLTTIAGVGSGDAADGYRVANPPRAPQTVDVYFTDGDTLLAHDVRPAGASQMVWPFVVETDIANTEVEVTLPDLSGVPNDLAVYLTDVAAGKRMYARTLPSYTFRSGDDGALRHFELEVAPRGADNLTIRSASVHSGNNGVVLTYDVSAACNVSVEVLNIAGRKVRELVQTRAVQPGTNELTWDLRSADGTVVPSGAYLIRIEAIAENGQRVQALRPAQVAR